MSEPSLAMQAEIVAVLKNAAAMTALINSRVYDRVPTSPAATFPYVRAGDDQVIADAAECLDGSVEIFVTLHVWAQGAVARADAKRVSGAIVTTIREAALAPSGYRLVSIEHESSRHLDDPDGITAHSVITFRALIDEE